MTKDNILNRLVFVIKNGQEDLMKARKYIEFMMEGNNEL